MRNGIIKMSRTVFNPYGVKMFRCCASCQHKRITLEGIRYCPKRRKKVKQLTFCKDWLMSRMLRQLRHRSETEEG